MVAVSPYLGEMQVDDEKHDPRIYNHFKLRINFYLYWCVRAI